MIPPKGKGKVVELAEEGDYDIHTPVITVEMD